MNEVIEKLCRIKTQYAINRLNPSSTDMIFIQYEELCLELNKQLQAYKEKEDKLREYLTNTEFEERTAYDASFCEGVYNTKEKALQILSEGGK